MGRNPATGEANKINASKKARITPLKGFKDIVLGAAPAPKLTKAATAKASPAKAAPANPAARTTARTGAARTTASKAPAARTRATKATTAWRAPARSTTKR